MIDLHNHILPGVDDGARDLAEALAMARMAVEQGTSIMAATPHRFHGGHEQLADRIESEITQLQRALDAHAIPLKIVPGVELQMRRDCARGLIAGYLLPLGGAGGKHVLVEPPFDRIPASSIPVLESILEIGFTPVLAHPERNSEIQKSLAFVEMCVSRGMPIQLTAGSIVGKFGPKPFECAKAISAHRDWPIVIASDAHDAIDRTPSDMREAVNIVAAWIGDEAAAMRMVDDLPRSLLP
jgi:protein-tyrosine phosphatase